MIYRRRPPDLPPDLPPPPLRRPPDERLEWLERLRLDEPRFDAARSAWGLRDPWYAPPLPRPYDRLLPRLDWFRPVEAPLYRMAPERFALEP